MVTPTLVGRDSELAVLTGMVDHIAAGGRSVVMLGDAGAGKSALLMALSEHGRAAGLRVLAAARSESQVHRPLAGLRDLLRPVLGSLVGLPDGQRQALGAVLGRGPVPAPGPLVVATAALSLIVGAAEERPVLVVVDDVQWLDRATQQVLAFVARRISTDAVVIVGAARAGDDGPLTSAGLPELPVRGLDDESARRLLAAHASDLGAADKERVLTAAQGNPLALIELPAALRRALARGDERAQSSLPLSARLERAFGARLPELPQPARDALLVAALSFADDPHEILAAASLLSRQPMSLAAFESAAAIGVVSFDDRHIQFRNSMLRSAVIAAETPARRNAAHIALADAVGDDPVRRSWHRAEAATGADDDLAGEIEAGHLTHCEPGSSTDAIRALDRAAQLTTDLGARARRLIRTAEYAADAGRADLARDLLGRASGLPLSELDLAGMASLQETFETAGTAQQPGPGVARLCDVAGRSSRGADPDLALNLLLRVAQQCWWSDPGAESRTQLLQAIGETAGPQDDLRRLAALGLAGPWRQGDHIATCLEAASHSITHPRGLWLAGLAWHAVGRPVQAADCLARAEPGLRTDGWLGVLARGLILQVLANLELGDWARAGRVLQDGRGLARLTGQADWAAGATALTALMAAVRSDSATAQAAATEGERAALGRRLNAVLSWVQLARGVDLLTAGKHSEAYEELRRLFDPDDAAFHETERFRGLTFLADAALRAGRAGEAREIMAVFDVDPGAAAPAILHRQLSYARAVLAHDDEAEDLYREALAGQNLFEWPWLRARFELAFGTWLRRQRRDAESRRYLRHAQATFDRIGASSWAEQARAGLRASGERAAGAGSVALGTLSAQELEIAKLAARGLSNREIGQQLYLSPRTIGSYLYRIFPRLGITSRSELGARLEALQESAVPTAVQSPD